MSVLLCFTCGGFRLGPQVGQREEWKKGRERAEECRRVEILRYFRALQIEKQMLPWQHGMHDLCPLMPSSSVHSSVTRQAFARM